MVLGVSDGGVSVARDFVVGLCDWRSDLMRVEVATGHGVDHADSHLVANHLDWCVGVKLGLVSRWVEEPFVVGIMTNLVSLFLASKPLVQLTGGSK